ncbi:cache domain-containing sensor histidine kinase [Paenibacillus whitsoniae]|uniref:Sensor histidine kinase n=1 Tax=Paenibacillus whitsoniae TaxID=2496558 RepID=A0A430JDR9_9BACL|nr:sensor histidine kinase [Paenibacillus whitsoniae]RTE09210.1 sensor histidine kinase [Paenibacillus whitsoniae]
MYNFIKSSLQWKLILMISCIVILVVITIGSFSYYKSARAIESDAQRFSNQILKQATLNLTRYINDNEQFFQMLILSLDFQDWANVQPGDSYSNYSKIKDMENRIIQPYINFHQETLSIVLYNENGNQIVYRNSNMDTVLDTDFSFLKSGFMERLTDSRRMQSFVQLRQDYKNSNRKSIELPILTYVQKIIYNEQTVYLAVDISLMPTQQILNQIELGRNGQALITNEHGSVISAPDLKMIDTKLDADILAKMGHQASGYVYDQDHQQMIVYQSIPKVNWHVIVFVPYRDLAERIIEIRNWTMAIALASLISAIVLVYLVSHSITKRMKLLRRTINTTKLGRFDIRTDVKGTDEVADLAETYNLLLDRIDDSIHLLAESKVVQQQAVLSALQSQINSHFLYNALESINAMANLAGHQQIRKSTVALSNMLRYTSNYRESLVTLEEEINHIRDYMHIMNNLYPGELEFHFQIDHNIAESACLKACLQPIVENCIKHGYEMTGEKLRVEITAYRYEHDYIRIDIEDDGIGISNEKLSEIREALNQVRTEQEFLQLSRIGMLNVHYRLKTYYPHHNLTGIRVERVSEDGGTRVSVIFPKKIKEN